MTEPLKPKMIFNTEAEPFYDSDGFWYSLFDGGYLNPNDFLTEGCGEVEAAIKVLREFYDGMHRHDLVEEM